MENLITNKSKAIGLQNSGAILVAEYENGSRYRASVDSETEAIKTINATLKVSGLYAFNSPRDAQNFMISEGN